MVLGYPGGGNFTATPARIRETIKLNGPDIYRDPTAGDPRRVHHQRQCGARQFGWAADRPERPVLGVVFGAAVDDPDTGFVLTANEVAGQLAKIGDTQPVPTGACVS